MRYLYTMQLRSLQILFLTLWSMFFSGQAFGQASSGPDSTSTEWWRDAVFYEIFVRSFSDSDGDGIGDFQGLIQRLDYLNDGDPATDSDLGIEAIWLMPINPSPSYHGYDVTDYRGINPDFGTMQDFREFLDSAHARGIHVIVDYVMNHSSSQHPWFIDSRNSNNGKRNYYRWLNSQPTYTGPWGQNVWHFDGSGYYYGLFWGGMPDLNYEEPEVRDSMFIYADYWSNDVGVDGFRLDAIKYIYEWEADLEDMIGTIYFWKDFEAFTDSVRPGSFNVGEAWTSTNKVVPYVENGGLDICFEFDLAAEIMGAANAGNTLGLRGKIDEVTNAYPDQRWGTFLTNHDMDRVFSSLNQDPGKNKAAASILMTLPGTPFIYYGEEIGMLGQKPDENIRRPMQWDASANAGFSTTTPWHPLNGNYPIFNVAASAADPGSLLNHYKRLIALRNQTKVLRRGDYLLAESPNSSVMSFWRFSPTDTLLIIVNTSAQTSTNVPINISGMSLSPGNYFLQNLLRGYGEQHSVNSQGYLTLTTISGYEAKVFSLTADATVNRFEEELHASDVSIYPNPTNGSITVKLDGEAGKRYGIRIVDLQGKELMEQKQLHYNREEMVNLEKLPAGSYLIEFKAASGRVVFPIVKQ